MSVFYILRRSAFHLQVPRKNKGREKVQIYERDIVCLPRSFTKHGIIDIPRKKSVRQLLAINKLVGKIQIDSAMSQSDIFREVRSVFSAPMGGDNFFQFKVLQSAGGDSRNLVLPQLSSSYRWTPSAFAGKNAKCPIYILAMDDLKVS